MTLIELLFFGIRVILAMACAFGFGSLFGWGVGIPIGIIVFAAFPKICNLLVKFFPQGKGNPVCPNGICENVAYEWVGERDSFPVCQCKCGIKFVHKGTRFEILNEDGTTTLYRVWNRKNGWVVPPKID